MSGFVGRWVYLRREHTLERRSLRAYEMGDERFQLRTLAERSAEHDLRLHLRKGHEIK